jgi:hypothetical protein
MHAQVNNDSVVYKYIIAQPQGSLFSDKCKLRIDDGLDPAYTSNYWILRKPSTKEEVQRIVDESIKKE